MSSHMRTWPHSGFSVDQSVSLPVGDQAGIERLVQYMTRCPFSLSRLVKVSDTGQVIYQAEKQARARLSRSQGRRHASGSHSQNALQKLSGAGARLGPSTLVVDSSRRTM